MKNIMKARAGILMIAMLFIVFTGFGQTTSDLIQNSTASTIVDDVGVNVVNDSIVASSEVFIVQVDQGFMEVNRVYKDNCEYLKFGELNQEATPNLIVYNIVNDIGTSRQDYLHITFLENKRQAATETLEIYRTARDGFSYSNGSLNSETAFVQRRARDGLSWL